jgi:hypothetical protein
MKKEDRLGILFWVLVIIFMFWLLTSCCKSQVPLINEHESSTTIRERLVTVRDTVTVKEAYASGEALFECDSLNRVRLKALNISESELLRLKALYDEQKQRLLIDALRPADTVYKKVFIPVIDTTSANKEKIYIKVPVEVEKYTYPWWLVALALVGVFLVGLKLFKFIKLF